MENRKRILQLSLIFLLLFILSDQSNGQIAIKTEPHQLTVFDTLKIDVVNQIKKSGYYYISWEVFERKKWRMVRVDIWNDVPMSEKWNKIQSWQLQKKEFVIDSIFTGTFKKYKQLLSRLVLTYSYSEELEIKSVVYSKKFIVKARQ